MKIVINTCYGGFDLSNKAVRLYAQLAGIALVEALSDFRDEFYCDTISHETYFSYRDIERDDGFLIETVETLGDVANGRYAKLKVVEIPDDVEWQICEYDGNEWIAEKHRVWQ